MGDFYFDDLTGEEFEEYLGRLFHQLGYAVEQTKATGDFGADLIILKDDEKTVVQAKRYNSPVGVSAIQEVIGSQKYYDADNCLVITNNQFTTNAKVLALSNNVELWDRDKLIKTAIQSVEPESFNKPTTAEIPDPDPLLPKAIELVTLHNKASVSMLMREFRVGYTRCAALMEKMIDLGIVGDFNGEYWEVLKPRTKTSWFRKIFRLQKS